MSDSLEHQIGLLLFPGLTQLGLTSPFKVLARLPSAQLQLRAIGRHQ